MGARAVYLHGPVIWMQATLAKGVTLDKAAPFRTSNPQGLLSSSTLKSWTVRPSSLKGHVPVMPPSMLQICDPKHSLGHLSSK